MGTTAKDEMVKLPDRDRLRKALDYDYETGILTWKPRGPEWFKPCDRFSLEAQARMWNGRLAGKQAFKIKKANGYIAGCVFGRSYLAHRIIWKHVTGQDPYIIDHINGDKADNRFCNLRSVPPHVNGRNRRVSVNNTSGVPGVRMIETGLWVAHIGTGEESSTYLGCFKTMAEAVAARKSAEATLGYISRR